MATKTIKGTTYEEIIKKAKQAMHDERDIFKKRYGAKAFKVFNRNEEVFNYMCENYLRHKDEWLKRYETHMSKQNGAQSPAFDETEQNS